MKKSAKFNLVKLLWVTLSSRRLIAVFLLMALLLGLLTFGQTSHEGPVIPIENESGFWSFYNNGTYHLVVYSYNKNGTPLASQRVKVVFKNSTSEVTNTEYATIGHNGMVVVNFSSNKSWLAELYLQELTGYQSSMGYTIEPGKPTADFLSCLPVYDHGFANRVGFLVLYVSPNGALAPRTQFRLAYSGNSSLQYSFDFASGSNTGYINLGSTSNFTYTYLYPNYAIIPSGMSTVYGILQYNDGDGWKNADSLYPVWQLVLIKPSQSYIEPQVYDAFFVTDVVFIGLFGIIFAVLSFGYPKATRSIELVAAKPFSRTDIIVSNYVASLTLISAGILSALVIQDLLFQYYFGIFLNAYSFLVTFAVSLMMGTTFLSITFLVSTVGNGFVSVFAIPLAILLFFYYIFGTLLSGLSVFLNTLGVTVSGRVVLYGSYFNPFQIISGIDQILRKKLELDVGGDLSFIPFSMSDMVLFLFLWVFLPILLASFIFRRTDL